MRIFKKHYESKWGVTLVCDVYEIATYGILFDLSPGAAMRPDFIIE